MPLDTNKIRRLMAGRTRGEVAAAAGIHRPNLLRILRGTHQPTLATVDKLARGLACKPKDLLL